MPHPTGAGILFSLGALAAALGHHLAGKLMQRLSARNIIVGGTLLAAAAVLLIIMAPSLWFVALAMPLFGIA